MTLKGFEDYTYDVTPKAQVDAERLWEYLNRAHVGFDNKIIGVLAHEKAMLNGGGKCQDAYVRRLVNLLRQWTCPVGSHQKGYWVCVNVAEIQMTIDHLLGRGKSIRTAYDGFRIAQDRMSDGQGELKL